MSDVDLKAPEVQAAIKEAVEEAITGLKNKNIELLSELKAARKTATIDPEEYSKLKDEKDVLTDKINELTKAVKQSQSELEKTTKLYQAELDQGNKLIVDNGLTQALNECKVKPELAKAVKAMFSSMVEVKDKQALLSGKSINDYVKEWAASDEGKHFVSAPVNSGGGSTGGVDGSGNKQVTRSTFDGMSHQERSTFAKSGGVVIDG